MNLKKTYAFMLFFILVLNCSVVSAGATMTADSNIVINRASGRINCTIPANTAQAIDIRIYLDKDETVTYDCTYSPKLSSIDFGVVAPDGLFYSLGGANGSINKSIRVNEPGQYILVIRNNENYAVAVSGTVKY